MPGVRFSSEQKAKAVRLVAEARAHHESEWAAIESVASKIGASAETVRKWVRRAQDAGEWAGRRPSPRPSSPRACARCRLAPRRRPCACASRFRSRPFQPEPTTTTEPAPSSTGKPQSGLLRAGSYQAAPLLRADPVRPHIAGQATSRNRSSEETSEPRGGWRDPGIDAKKARRARQDRVRPA